MTDRAKPMNNAGKPAKNIPLTRVDDRAKEVEACVFCDKFTNNDSIVMIFEPLNPVVPGHMLVVPRQHVTDFADDSTITALVMADAAEYAKAQGGEWNVITSKGEAATQSVFHLHIHLVPRVKNDGLLLPWSSTADLIKRAEVEARLDEAMVESLAYSMELDVDESEVLKVRDSRINELRGEA